ncbi:hypothetical protein MRX96_054832 [Rhipicephalus microplus]
MDKPARQRAWTASEPTSGSAIFQAPTGPLFPLQPLWTHGKFTNSPVQENIFDTSAASKATSQQFAVNGNHLYRRLAPFKTLKSGAATVLSMNVMPSSLKDLHIPAVVGDQALMSLLVDTGTTASLLTKKN